MTRVGVAGAAGKMGQALVRLMAGHPALRLTAAWERNGHPNLRQDAGVLAGINPTGVVLQQFSPAWLQECDMVIDFTAPEATLALLAEAVQAGKSMIIGTTGLKAEQLAQLKSAGEKIALVYATNYSTAMNVLWALARQAAAVLGDNYDAEIVEFHHNQKKDSPSGTAVTLLEAICQGKGWDASKVVKHGREGLIGARPKQEIGMHAVRAGDIVGDHTAIFSGQGERLELKHQAHSRDTLAMGAVRAAAWLAGKKAGLYRMAQVLGLDPVTD